MASLPWWSFLGVGLFVIITATMLGGPITLFSWVGIIFIVVGIAKLVYLIILTPKKMATQHAKPPQHHYRAKLACPRCMVSANQQDNYCKYCGTQLKKRTQAY